MPVAAFMSTFLPLSDETVTTKPSFNSKHFSEMNEEQAGISNYEPFIKLVYAAEAMPGFKIINTSQYADRRGIHGMKSMPDVACYLNGVNASNTLTRYEDMELIFEFNPKHQSADPFEDDLKNAAHANEEGDEEEIASLFENKGKKQTRCRGQIACYARIWCSCQYRTHCFIVWIGDPDARIIRLDRSGGIVSAKFNYRTSGHLLLDFLWCHSMSSGKARGLDPTITRASEEETKLVRGKLVQWKPASERSVFKLQIPDPDSDEKKSHKTHLVFVWGSLADPNSVTGRATRGYPAWNADWNDGEGRIVFVKDSWRSCEPGMKKESDILKILNKAGVRNVPQLLCGGDLPGQFTVTQDYAKEPWNKGASEDRFVKRAHTRFAEDVVGYHLSEFKSSRELLQAIYDAILAHKDAFEKCGILHRNISGGNILMKKGGGGILNDWDLAKRIDKDMSARQPFRSGTWQFMSGALLLQPDKINSLQDDLESFFWVVLYHTLRYMKHNRIDILESVMDYIFDEEHEGPPGQPICGGWGKHSVFLSLYPVGIGLSVDENKPMTTFIDTMLDHWEEWYGRLANISKKIARAMASKGISEQKAAKQFPFDPSDLAMHDYDAMVSAFETVLALETWPKGDEALDCLPKQAKRGRDNVRASSDSLCDSRNSRRKGALKKVHPSGDLK